MKKSLKLFILVTCSFLTVFLISCNDDDDNNSHCTNVACTEIFVTIIVSIEDQNQNPIALDSIEVINVEDGSDMTVSLSPSGLELAQQFGQYPLITDGDVEVNQELELRFKGFINNQEVIGSDYTVAADCCHVSLVAGDLDLVL